MAWQAKYHPSAVSVTETSRVPHKAARLPSVNTMPEVHQRAEGTGMDLTEVVRTARH